MSSRQLCISSQYQRRNALSHTAHHPRTEPARRNLAARAHHAAGATAKVEKISHPTVDEGISLEDWLYFEQRWQEYKESKTLPETPA